MHSLEQLRSGELAGITRLDLCCNLTDFPEEIFSLADSLEVLNLSGNRLSALPADLARLHKLRIVFCSDNLFTSVPEVLGNCTQLEMIGFKSNRIQHLPAAALPPALRWLILTDNRLQQLPPELGDCAHLQKLMLAGNRLHALPESLAKLQRLELLRIAANRLEHLPAWLSGLPSLCWLAFAGNPLSDASEAEILRQHSLPTIARDTLELGEILGQGASGIIRSATWQRPNQPAQAMAVKIFKGDMTSDGLAHSEMSACIAAAEHHNLISVAGPLQPVQDGPPGLLLERIAPSFQALAGPPSLASCTRDCYAEQRRFTVAEALRILRGTAAAVAHLHKRGILHGDLYAHNLLVDEAGQTLLGDFGAASFFEPQSSDGIALQQLETRAFACLLEELLHRCNEADQPHQQTRLWQLHAQCSNPQRAERPLFVDIQECLQDCNLT
ncbi:protein kinase [Pseudomonas sp.]|uniref:protein kinase n=1 Tax=Pseudomonas sp. TaxID=306 RepID=UPI003BB731DD